MASGQGESGAERGREVGRLEWAVGALGAAIVTGVLGVLIYDAATYQEGAPVLVSRIIGVTPTEGGYVVRLETENRGPTTVAEVVVKARLKQGDTVLEEAETTLDYVARRSRRQAGVIFARDPGSASVELAPSSYRKP